MLTIATVFLGLVLLWLSAHDARFLRLPDVVTLPLLVSGIALSTYIGGIGGLRVAAIGASLGWVSLWAVAAVYRRWRGHTGLGLGDAKLLAAAGAWLGPLLLAPTVFIGAVLALGYVAILRGTGHSVSTQSRIPFGPFLSAGFFFLWCLHVATLV